MVSLMIYLGISVVCIFVLGLTDPKRLKQRKDASSIAPFRFVLVLLSLFPGVWLLFNLAGAFFLIWFGIVTMAGWFVALLLQDRVS
ncbi:MAG: hypothetical protein JJ964_02055 [Rhizobiales bacterium]|nr:hypothetical protein [Hyphomicrobiales bacterium]